MPLCNQPPLTPGNVNAVVNRNAGARDPNSVLSSIPANWKNERQLVGTWLESSASDPNLISGQATPVLTATGDFILAQTNAPTWWTVSLHGFELDRLVPFGGALVPALSKAQIVDQGQLVSRIKAEIRYGLTDSERRVVVDVGSGGQLAVYGSAVHVLLMYPSDREFVELGTTTNQAVENALTFGPGLVTDMLISGSAIASSSPIGHRSTTFSERVVQLANAVVATVVPIPAGAKRLTIYQDAANPGTSPWQWVQGVDQVTGLPTQLYSDVVIDPVLERVDQIVVPQNVTAIQQTGGVVVNRAWQLVWGLDL